MDKDRIKGKMEDIGGRVKRQAGEWTGDRKLQDEGAADQLKGKTRDAVGKVKDAGRDLADDLRGREHEHREHEHMDREREKDKAA